MLVSTSINEVKNQEIDRDYHNQYQKRRKKLTSSYPQKEIQQTNFEHIINQMAKTKPRRILGGRFGTERKKGS